MNEVRYRKAESQLWRSLGLAPVERWLRLEGLGTQIRIQEVGDGPVVVFVHGGSASGANWAPLVAQLPGFRCILLDRPGCGLSEPAAIDLHDLDRFIAYADDLVVDMLDALSVPMAKVVATSLGGLFSLRGAAAHPSRFERIVEFGYVPGAPMTHLPMSMRAAMIPGVRRLMTAIPPTRGAVRMILRQLGLGPALQDGTVTDEGIEWFRSLLRDTSTMRNEMNLPREILLPGTTSTAVLPLDVLAEVQCRVDFIWADDDPLGGAGDVGTRFVGHIAGAHLERWTAGGHAPWMADAERAAASVSEFLGA